MLDLLVRSGWILLHGPASVFDWNGLPICVVSVEGSLR